MFHPAGRGRGSVVRSPWSVVGGRASRTEPPESSGGPEQRTVDPLTVDQSYLTDDPGETPIAQQVVEVGHLVAQRFHGLPVFFQL